MMRKIQKCIMFALLVVSFLNMIGCANRTEELCEAVILKGPLPIFEEEDKSFVTTAFWANRLSDEKIEEIAVNFFTETEFWLGPTRKKVFFSDDDKLYEQIEDVSIKEGYRNMTITFFIQDEIFCRWEQIVFENEFYSSGRPVYTISDMLQDGIFQENIVYDDYGAYYMCEGWEDTKKIVAYILTCYKRSLKSTPYYYNKSYYMIPEEELVEEVEEKSTPYYNKSYYGIQEELVIEKGDLPLQIESDSTPDEPLPVTGGATVDGTNPPSSDNDFEDDDFEDDGSGKSIEEEEASNNPPR